MTAARLNKAVRHLRRVLVHHDAARSDTDLLAAYTRQHDQSAFEALLRRHGPMVMGVCRRILRNRHDAEDAFQTTFLVLVRKASTLRSPGLLANWLYGVAHRTALEARKAAARRRAKEATVVPPTPTPEDTWADLRPVLDQELQRLPATYRAVIVLCDLEGRTRKETARHLGCPEGTVASRLATARRLLAKRLARHGVGVSGGLLAAVLAEHAAAPVSAAVFASTADAAGLLAAGAAIPAPLAALTEGVLKAMLLDRLKPAGLILAGLLVGLLGTAAGLQSSGALGAQEPRVEPYGEQRLDREGEAPDGPGLANRRESIKGTWVLQSVERGGRRLPVKPGSVRLVITNRFLIWEEGAEDRAFLYRVDPDKSPMPIDLTFLDEGRRESSKPILGICKVEGGELSVCESDGPRPAEFTARPRSGCTLYTYRAAGAGGTVALGPSLLRAEQGDLAEVEPFLRREIRENHPESARILEALTKGYLRVYRLHDALWSADEWVKRWPDDAQAHYWRGRVYEQIPDLPWASGTVVQTNGSWGNDVVIVYNPTAAAEYRRAVELDPELDAAHLRLGEHLLANSAPQEASAQFERLRQRHPKDPAVRLGLARCALALGKPDESRKLLADLLAESPHDAPALAERGKLALEEGQLPDAEKWLRQSLALAPEDRQANYLLSQCLAGLGKPDEARQYREKLRRIEAEQTGLRGLVRKTVDSPNDAAPWTEGGKLLLRTGREREGLAWLLHAVRLDAHYRPANQALADYYQRTGKKELTEKYRALAQ
jgi:RNA polymerase sigma factor (sigma-70 family)